jgi:integrase/recombinase XerC
MHRDRATVTATVLRGLRCREILRLRLSDLHFCERRLFITRAGHQRLIPPRRDFFTEVSAYLHVERPAGISTDLMFVVLKASVAASASS